MTGADLPNLGTVAITSSHDARKYAGALLNLVLEEKIEPRIAINRWPENPDAEVDLSLNCALQALWYFEADTERQKTELFYMDIQWNLLKQMADCLSQGDDLPPYILKEYLPQVRKSRVRFFYTRTFWKALLFELKGWRRQISDAFQQGLRPLIRNK